MAEDKFGVREGLMAFAGLAMLIGLGARLGGCTEESSQNQEVEQQEEALQEQEGTQSQETTPEPVEDVLDPIVVNTDDFYDALLLREDENGRTDLSYKMDLSRDAVVKFDNAFFYAMATGGVDWEAKFSSKKDGSTPIINCVLVERDEKEFFVKNDMKRLMTVVGTVQYLQGDTVFLKNCRFKDI